MLVLGAGGAVGQSAIGAARVLGAGRVVAVCRPGASAERARRGRGRRGRRLHTDDVDALTAAISRAPSADRSTSSSTRSAAPAATAAAAGARPRRPAGQPRRLSADAATFSSAALRSRSLEVLGYTNNALTPEQRRDALTAVLAHAAEGMIRVAHEAWPLERAEEAWARQASAEVNGRLVLVP